MLAVSCVASAVFLIIRPFVSGDWPVLFKVLSILLLAALGFRQNVLLGLALTVSSVGDVLLGVSRIGSNGTDQLFLWGLSAFLIAHLLYIVLFRKFASRAVWKASWLRIGGTLLIPCLLVLLLTTLYASLGAFRIPVFLYSFVIAAMGVSALFANVPVPAGIGALLFIASDSMIALEKFHAPILAGAQLIWITYYLAQLLIERSFEKRAVASGNVSPARQR